MWRNILAVVAGIIAGIIAIMIVEGFSHFLFPYPEGLDYKDKVALAQYIKTLPAGALLLVALAWASGSFVAAVVTTLIAREKQLQLSILDGAILMIFGIINMLRYPHPVWFWILGIAVFIPFAYLGYYFWRKK